VLAYDLFLQNKSSPAISNVKRVKPVKKIYHMKKGDARLDDTTPQEYGSEIRFKVQEVLSMPFNTSPYLSLPNKTTGANQPRPYIEFYGRMESRKNTGTVFLISRSGKNEKGVEIKFDASYNIETKQRTIRVSENDHDDSSVGIFLNIDKKHYFIEDKSLFQRYIDSGALTSDSFLPAGTFKTVCNVFFDSVEERWKDDINDRRMDFSLFVLPTDVPVEYREEGSLVVREQQLSPNLPSSSLFSSSLNSSTSDQRLKKEIDAFGSSLIHYPRKPTQTAKFMSFDDPAFSINFTAKENFYKNLFIGLESHERIGIPADNIIEISGFNWMFTDTSDPDQRFEKTGKGIYYQLWHNYMKLKKKAGDPYAARAQMKVVCFKTTQAKVEVLINENLTMPDLERLFSPITNEEIIPSGALELLIQRKERTVLWSDYIDAVRALLSRRRTNYHWLLATFTKMIRTRLFDLIARPYDARVFFSESEFCIKVLSRTKVRGLAYMNETENFAYKAGKIAGRYVRFKERNEESTSSLKDILTYSKYDREKLRFVIQRVGLGLNLSKADKEEIEKITSFIKKEMPEKEIDDDNSHIDCSYFFYKGVFEELGADWSSSRS
jgi:hypothetical protein